MIKKRCNKCKKLLSLSKFTSNKAHKDGKQNYCRDCKRKYDKKWNIKNRDKYLKYHHRYSWNNKYNLTIDEYNDLYNKQKGCCVICGRHQKDISNKRGLCIEHNHKTGKVRGLVCDRCNILIANIENNKHLLSIIFKYLNFEEYN